MEKGGKNNILTSTGPGVMSKPKPAIHVPIPIPILSRAVQQKVVGKMPEL